MSSKKLIDSLLFWEKVGRGHKYDRNLLLEDASEPGISEASVSRPREGRKRPGTGMNGIQAQV